MEDCKHQRLDIARPKELGDHIDLSSNAEYSTQFVIVGRGCEKCGLKEYFTPGTDKND